MHHDPNIAPQHMFDGVSLADHPFHTPALPNLGSNPSPGPMGDGVMTYESLIAQNTLLKTRVSELEVINMMYSDNENNLRRERDDALNAQEELKRKVEDLERQVYAPELEHPNKRARIEEPTADGQQSQNEEINDDTQQ